MKRPSQRFIHKRSLAHLLACSRDRAGSERIRWIVIYASDARNRFLMLRFVLPARIPSLEGEAIGRVRELRAIVHAQRGSSSIVSPFLPFSDTTSLPLPFRRGYTSPSFYPATPFPFLSYLSARIPTGFFDSDLEGGKRVYPRAKGRRVRLIRGGKWVSFHGSSRFSLCFSSFFLSFFTPCESTVP